MNVQETLHAGREPFTMVAGNQGDACHARPENALSIDRLGVLAVTH